MRQERLTSDVCCAAGAAARLSAAAVADGLLCAYKPQSPDGPPYFEQDGAPPGRIIGDPSSGGRQQMRCHDGDSYCFSIWRETVGNGTDTLPAATLLQGQSLGVQLSVTIR